MLKFYTNIKELTPENRKRVFPMLFDWFYLELAIVKEYFQSVATIEEADICILPIDLGFYFNNNRENEVNQFIDTAKKKAKPIWIYSAGDFGITLPNDVIVFRLGGFHSKMHKNNFIMPSFINDPYSFLFNNTWEPQKKNEKPTVGFVGNADGSLTKWGKELFIYSKQQLNRLLKKDKSDSQLFFPSSRIRYSLLEKLRLSSQIECNFIYRKKYRAGANTEELKRKTTLEFYQNIEQNMYTFCLRGSGNFSVRFYETLMMGRIPILIDTDVRLPFQDEINWEKHCILATAENYLEKLVCFHTNHSEKELEEIQQNNRMLLLQKLNRQAYFIAISKIQEVYIV